MTKQQADTAAVPLFRGRSAPLRILAKNRASAGREVQERSFSQDAIFAVYTAKIMRSAEKASERRLEFLICGI